MRLWAQKRGAKILAHVSFCRVFRAAYAHHLHQIRVVRKGECRHAQRAGPLVEQQLLVIRRRHKSSAAFPFKKLSVPSPKRRKRRARSHPAAPVKKSFSPSSRKYSSVFKGRGRRCPNSLERAPPLPSNPARRDRSDSGNLPGAGQSRWAASPRRKKKHFLVYRHGVKAHHIGVGQRLQAPFGRCSLPKAAAPPASRAVPPAALPQKNPAGREDIRPLSILQPLFRFLRRHGVHRDKNVWIDFLKFPPRGFEVGNAAFAAGFEGDDVPKAERPGIFFRELFRPQRIDVFYGCRPR